MDLPAILVKAVGAVLLLWTAYSIVKHFAGRKPAAGEGAAKNDKNPSVSEQILNNLLLYLWLAFMVIFSTGMILNK